METTIPPPSLALRALSRVLRLASRAPWSRRAGQPPRRILVICRGMIGDVIRTTSFLADVRRWAPDAHVTYMTGAGGAAVLVDNPDIDAIVDYLPMPSAAPRDLARFAGAVRRLRRRRCDLGVCLTADSWDALLLQLGGAAMTVGLVEPGREFLVDSAVVWDETSLKPMQECLDDVLRALGVAPQCRRYRFPETPELMGRVQQAIATAREAVRPLVVVAPGGGHNPTGCAPYRQWFPERFAAVIDALVSERDAAVVLVGGEEDRDSSRRVLGALDDAARERICDLTGATTLLELGGLLRAADLLITNDSAPVWIAAAVECPVVDIFGCNQPEVHRPLAERYVTLHGDVLCHPCYRPTRVPTCEIPPRCLAAVGVADVLAAARELMGWSDARG